MTGDSMKDDRSFEDWNETDDDRSTFFPFPLPKSSASIPNAIPLIDEMLEGMALSMLIFLMADLRLLSATGRISLKWETMILDNDLMLRTTANQVAGLMKNVTDISSQTERYQHIREGLSPAQLMAMVLVETKKTIDAKNAKKRKELKNGMKMKKGGPSHAAASFRRTDSTSKTQQDIFWPVADIAATGEKDELNPLLKAYVHIVAQDMNREVPSVEARRSTLSLLDDPEEIKLDEEEESDIERQADLGENEEEGSDFERQEQDEVEGNNDQGSSTSVPDRSTNIGPHVTKAKSNVRFGRKSTMQQNQEVGSNGQPRTEEVQNPLNNWLHASNPPNFLNAAAAAAHQVQENMDRRLHELQERRKTMMMSQKERDKLRVEETTDALFGMGNQQPRVRASVMSSLEKVKRKDRLGRKLSSNELLMIMERAVESRIHDKLNFMSSFFRPGTICRLMCKSNTRVVWINDWYPLKDLTYAIAVDQDKRRLLVLFRGAVTKQDWSKAMDSDQKMVPNPIEEEFEGRPEKVGIYSGFYQYLFRVRKDTGTTKYDEIVNLAHQYGMNRIGEDYHLAVTGHSLGAALSTVFCLYASTEDRFTRNGPIKVISFGCPMIGGNDFADCFRHQEQQGKIMYTRFYNHNDLVAYMPANMAVTKRGSYYRHIGIGVRIPKVPRPIRLPFGVFQRRWRPSVYYIGKEGFWASYCRGISRNALLNAPWFWQTQKMHTLMEMLQRLMEGSAIPQKGHDFDLLKQPVEVLYRDLAGIAPVIPNNISTAE